MTLSLHSSIHTSLSNITRACIFLLLVWVAADSSAPGHSHSRSIHLLPSTPHQASCGSHSGVRGNWGGWWGREGEKERPEGRERGREGGGEPEGGKREGVEREETRKRGGSDLWIENVTIIVFSGVLLLRNNLLKSSKLPTDFLLLWGEFLCLHLDHVNITCVSILLVSLYQLALVMSMSC